MISALYFGCHPPENTPQQQSSCLCKVSLVIFELLLIGVGCALYFSGVGVIPASILWGAPLVVELGIFAFDCFKQDSESSISRRTVVGNSHSVPKTEEEKVYSFNQILEEMRLTDTFDDGRATNQSLFVNTLIGKGIVAFASQGKGGLTLNPGKYIPPGCSLPNPRYDNLIYMGSQDCSVITDWLHITSGPQEQKDIGSFLWIVAKCERPPLIVMTTECEEPRINADFEVKPEMVCWPYWPSGDLPMSIGGISVTLLNENEKERKLRIQGPGCKTREITQYCFKEWSSSATFDKEWLMFFVYTTFSLKQVREHGKTVIVHDDNGKGRAGVFAICLILQALHEASKKANVPVTVDLEGLVGFMRYDSLHGREGLIDSPNHYDTIVQFATYLKDKQ